MVGFHRLQVDKVVASSCVSKWPERCLCTPLFRVSQTQGRNWVPRKRKRKLPSGIHPDISSTDISGHGFTNNIIGSKTVHTDVQSVIYEANKYPDTASGLSRGRIAFGRLRTSRTWPTKSLISSAVSNSGSSNAHERGYTRYVGRQSSPMTEPTDSEFALEGKASRNGSACQPPKVCDTAEA